MSSVRAVVGNSGCGVVAGSWGCDAAVVDDEDSDVVVVVGSQAAGEYRTAVVVEGTYGSDSRPL